MCKVFVFEVFQISLLFVDLTFSPESFAHIFFDA